METMNNTAEREVIIARTLNAPRELVFEAWTKPEHIIHWYGPNGFTLTIHEMEVHPNGVWRFIMHGPDGTDYPNKIVFEEVVKPERLVYTHGTGVEDDFADFHVIVTFDDNNGKTDLTMRSIFPTKESRDKVVREYGAIEGGNQTVNRLEEYLATKKA